MFRYLRPAWAAHARRALRPLIIFILVFIMTFGVYANLYMFRLMTVRMLISGLLLPWCGFMFGCFTALAARQPPGNVAAISIETGVQNTGIAIMLLKASFEQPVADMSSTVPVVVSCFTPVPLLFAVLMHWVARRVRGEDVGEDKSGTPPEDDAVDDKETVAMISATAAHLENGGRNSISSVSICRSEIAPTQRGGRQRGRVAVGRRKRSPRANARVI